MKLQDVEEKRPEKEWMTDGWMPECDEGGVVETYVESVDNGWTARQVWGFTVVGDKRERKYARKVVVRKGDKVRTARLVYDWKS